MIESMKKRYETGEAMLDEYGIRLEQDRKRIESAKNILEERKAKMCEFSHAYRLV